MLINTECAVEEIYSVASRLLRGDVPLGVRAGSPEFPISPVLSRYVGNCMYFTMDDFYRRVQRPMYRRLAVHMEKLC